MVTRGTVLGVALGALLGLAGCDQSRTLGVSGPTTQSGILVESLEVELTTRDSAGTACRVFGTLRNQTEAGHRVTLVLEAFDGRGHNIATARATVDFVGAGARANYQARFRNFSQDGFLNECDPIARVEVADNIL
jgi:hypothetical protein